MTDKITEAETMKADPSSEIEQARSFAAYCRSSAFDQHDGPMLATMFDALASALAVFDEKFISEEYHAEVCKNIAALTAERAKKAEHDRDAALAAKEKAEAERDESIITAQECRSFVKIANAQVSAISELTRQLAIALTWLVDLKDFPPKDYADQKPLAWESSRAALRMHAEHYAALTAAARALEEAPTQGWLPIESAPKDGTTIIVFRPNANNKYILRVSADRWLEIDGRGVWAKSNASTQPTHWQPLPVSPDEGMRT